MVDNAEILLDVTLLNPVVSSRLRQLGSGRFPRSWVLAVGADLLKARPKIKRNGPLSQFYPFSHATRVLLPRVPPAWVFSILASLSYNPI